MKQESGYEETIVRAFLTAHGERNGDGVLVRLNEIRVDDYHRRMIKKWESLELIPMARLDSFLMRHDFMLFEFEMWSEENFTYDGFHDPYAEPSGLVA